MLSAKEERKRRRGVEYNARVMGGVANCDVKKRKKNLLG